jgi:hypothetical protein
MHDMRDELPRSEAILSRIFHTPGLSSAINLLSTTLLRPRALLTGGIAATITLLSSYLLARLHDYVVSGSEVLLGFAIGWATGLLYDCFVLLIRRVSRTEYK